MLDAPVIEVAISLAFIFLLLSLIVSWINELIVTYRGIRGKYLRNMINKALDDRFNKNWAELIYLHPMVDILSKKENRSPSYIPSRLFAHAFTDLIINESKEFKFVQDESLNVSYAEKWPSENPMENFKLGLAKLKESEIKIMLRSVLANSNNDLENVKKDLAIWYDQYMDRVGGWYKRKIWRWLFMLSLLVCLFLNVDVFTMVPHLWKNSTLREAVVASAESFTRENQALALPNDRHLTAGQIADSLDNLYRQLGMLHLPIGWEKIRNPGGIYQGIEYTLQNKGTSWEKFCYRLNCYWQKTWDFIKWLFVKSIRWSLTAIAISFGAPFWFDALNRLVNIRGAGKKPAELREER